MNSSKHNYLSHHAERLKLLLTYVAADPENHSLIWEAAMAGASAGDHEACEELLKRLEEIQPLSIEQLNQRGISLLSRGRIEEASDVFATIAADGSGDAVVSYNLAYSFALSKQYERAVAMLDNHVLATTPAAITLKMQCMHHLGLVDDAIYLGKQHTESPQVGETVSGILSTLFFDLGDFDSARTYAADAPLTAAGATVLGLLCLETDEPDQARQNFEHALQIDPSSGRASLGLGLVHLANHCFHDAAASLDHAAKLLPTHAGAWLSAGWAHFLVGDVDQARTRFEKSFEIDRGFAEAIAALAITDIGEDRMSDAKRRLDTSLRLDRESLTANMAQILVFNQEGESERSSAMLEGFVNRHLDEAGGASIAKILTRRSLRVGSGR